MKTGYFARATEDGHTAKFTQVHIVDNYNKPFCRYRPHKTMKFQWCANSIVLSYIECKRCKTKLDETRKRIGSLLGRIGG